LKPQKGEILDVGFAREGPKFNWIVRVSIQRNARNAGKKILKTQLT